MISETNEFESANYGYKFGQEQETYNIVAANGYFGRLIFHYASFNEKKSYPKFVDRFPQTKFANPEDFCYFVSRKGRYGFLSNWLVEKGNGHVGEDGHNFLTSEHELMYLKAKVFKDVKVMGLILETKDPAKVKKLNRQVSNFKERIWFGKRYKCCYQVVFNKFSQSPELKKLLLSTGDKYLVE